MSNGFKKTGLSNLVNEIKKYQNPQIILDNIMSRLCDIGVNAIKKAYKNSWSGESAASVDGNKINNTTWEISAHSEGLLYLEFGAGITRNKEDNGEYARTALDNGLDTGNDIIYDIGTYGLGQGSNYNWYAPPLQKKTTGTRARHGFANAITEIYANLDKVIKEEMSK